MAYEESEYCIFIYLTGYGGSGFDQDNFPGRKL